MPAERLQKILSNAGVASRRVAEELILAGRVAVNGAVQDTLGARADPETDEITVDGVPVLKTRYRYFALHKPAGFVTTARDDQGRETVLDLIPIGDIQLHPVGRLDLDSEGLVIITNDGHLTDLLTHPRYEVEKEYLVGLDSVLSKRDLERLVRGIEEGGDRLRAVAARPAMPPATMPGEEGPAAGAWLLLTLREGKNREIRRMMTALGRRVHHLRRIRVGPLHLGTLGSGAFRELTPEEVDALYRTGTSRRDAAAEAAPAGTEYDPPPVSRDLPTPIAIDGPAASGKSTLGMELAERFGYAFLDTGLMYRAVTLAAVRAGLPVDDAAAREFVRELDLRVEAGATTRIFLGDEDVTDRLRDPEVEANVSHYSALPSVREAMVSQQRAIAAKGLAVLAGRDIGTVVLPDAPLKFYLEASEDARAERRSRQAGEWGQAQGDAEARKDIHQRDVIDSTRKVAPLRAAGDAIVIDTTALSLAEVLELALEKVQCASA